MSYRSTLPFDDCIGQLGGAFGCKGWTSELQLSIPVDVSLATLLLRRCCIVYRSVTGVSVGGISSTDLKE
jgi:hypothetical protein